MTRLTPRQLAETIGTLAAAYIITPPRSAGIIHEAFRGYDNILRAAMGVDPAPAPPGRPPWTITGARQTLYDTHRQRWIDSGDLEELDLMVRHVR